MNFQFFQAGEAALPQPPRKRAPMGQASYQKITKLVVFSIIFWRGQRPTALGTYTGWPKNAPQKINYHRRWREASYCFSVRSFCWAQPVYVAKYFSCHTLASIIPPSVCFVHSFFIRFSTAFSVPLIKCYARCRLPDTKNQQKSRHDKQRKRHINIISMRDTDQPIH